MLDMSVSGVDMRAWTLAWIDTSPRTQVDTDTRMAAVCLLATHSHNGAREAVRALVHALTSKTNDCHVKRAALQGLFAVVDPKDVTTTADLGISRILKRMRGDITQDVAVRRMSSELITRLHSPKLLWKVAINAARIAARIAIARRTSEEVEFDQFHSLVESAHAPVLQSRQPPNSARSAESSVASSDSPGDTPQAEEF